MSPAQSYHRLRDVQFVAEPACQRTELGPVASMIPVERYHRDRPGHLLPAGYHRVKPRGTSASEPEEQFVSKISKRDVLLRARSGFNQLVPVLVFAIAERVVQRLVNVAVLAPADFTLGQRADHSLEVEPKRGAVCHIICARVAAAMARLQPQQDRQNRVLQKVLAAAVAHAKLCQTTISVILELPFLKRGELSNELEQPLFCALCFLHTSVFGQVLNHRAHGPVLTRPTKGELP